MRAAVILAVVAAAAPAAAADWRLAAESDRAASYLDMTSVALEGGKARFSRWMVLAAATAAGADNIRDSFTVECATRRYTVVKAELLQGERSVGGLPASGGVAAEGSVLASLADIACGRRQPDGAAVPDPLAAGKARLAAAKSR